jgi:PAS domain S-box-containing protein
LEEGADGYLTQPVTEQVLLATVRSLLRGRRAEQALRQTSALLNAVLENATTPIYVKDTQGRFILSSRHHARLLGCTPQQVLGKTDDDFAVSAPRCGEYTSNDQMVLEAGQAREFEETVCQPDGQHVYLSIKFPLHNTDGQVYAVGGISTDITQRRADETALRDREAKLRAFVDANVIGILFGDLDGRVYDCNEEMARILGRSRQDVLEGKVHWTDLTPEEDLPLDDKAAVEAKATGRCAPYEKHYLRPDGSRVPVMVGYVLLEPERQKSVAFILDISSRKAAEAALQEAKEVAEAANRAKDRFLAMLSHELRTPLTPVLMAASVLREDPRFPESYRDDMELIHRNVDLEARLIDDLLDLTRIVRGKLELNMQVVDLCQALCHAATTCDPEARSKGLRIVVERSTAPLLIRGDAARLQQIFWNLIKNAVKFTDSGVITVSCRAVDPTTAQVRVTDTGMGIEPAALQGIFNAFEQAPGVTRKFGGLGLGLAISKALVQMHSGLLEAHSEGLGKGATFTVCLPLATDVAPPAEARGMPHATSGSLRILLVEDHQDSARLLARLLRGMGHGVSVAGDIATALRVAKAEHFDLLISDIGLPDGTGLDLMRQLRSHKPIKGVALSGHGMEEDLERSRQAGFIAHLTKPVSMNQIEDVIARAMDSGH